MGNNLQKKREDQQLKFGFGSVYIYQSVKKVFVVIVVSTFWK